MLLKPTYWKGPIIYYLAKVDNAAARAEQAV